MPHNPSMPDDIARRILARTTTLGGANSAAQNGDLATVIGNASEELSIIDRRFYEDMVQAHYFKNSRGVVLRNRVAQLPKDFPPPRSASPATGGAVRLKRLTSVASATFAPGTIAISQRLQNNLIYKNADELTMDVGVLQLDNCSFVCATQGTAGSAGIGDVNVVDASPGDVITYARNLAAMVGVNEETDDEIARRAERWLWAQAQAQPEAVEILTKAFKSETDPTRISSAKCWTDIEHPGYSEVYLGNGAGMYGFTRPANSIFTTIPVIPAGRRHMFRFDFPAATPPKMRVTGPGHAPYLYTYSNKGWTAQEETGEMVIRRNPEQYGLILNPGDVVETYGHSVYTGITVELQRYYNRFCAGLGTRIRARHGSPQFVSIMANVVIAPYPGGSRDQILAAIKRAIRAFMSQLEPGAPLILHDLHAALTQGRVRGLINIIFDHGDIYAGGDNKQLITTDTLIVLR